MRFVMEGQEMGGGQVSIWCLLSLDRHKAPTAHPAPTLSLHARDT